jgi:hypothetical protein
MKDDRSLRRPARAGGVSVRVTAAAGIPREAAAALLDASVFGARLVVPAPLAAGAAVQVRLEVPGEAGPVFWPGKVVWSDTQPDGRHHAAVHFEQPLPYHVLRALTEPPVSRKDPPDNAEG